MPAEHWLTAAALTATGLAIGSFIAVVAVRWPQGRSVIAGRSLCDSCGRGLAAGELVPVLSYLLQRGRCRGCGAPIAIGHVLIELAGAAVGLAAGLSAIGVQALAGALFGWTLLALAALDLAAYWLPNRLTALLAVLGIAFGLAGIAPPSLADRAIGGIAGFVALWLVGEGYRRLRGRQGLGGGDPKLFGAIGLWLGWRVLPLVMLGACLLGLAGITLLMIGGRRVTGADRLPLGTLLAIAAFAVWLGMALHVLPV